MKKLIKKFFTIYFIEKYLVALLGKYPENIFLKKLRPWCTYYPKNSFRACERMGVRYYLDISDYQEWSLYYHSSADSSNGILEYILLDQVILDVGGNIGQTAMMMGLKTGEKGKIYSFEPFPSTYLKFLNNLSINKNILNVEPQCIALGAETGELHMCIKEPFNNGQNHLINKANTNDQDLVSVKVSTIDSFVKEHSILKIDFIKIDVEGFEMNVLKGALHTIKTFHPSMIIELDDTNLRVQGSTAAELCEYISNLGYSIREHGNNVDLSPADYGRHMDIYCSFIHSSI